MANVKMCAFCVLLAISQSAATTCSTSADVDYGGNDHVNIMHVVADPGQCCDLCCNIQATGDVPGQLDAWTFVDNDCWCKVYSQTSPYSHAGATSGRCPSSESFTSLVVPAMSDGLKVSALVATAANEETKRAYSIAPHDLNRTTMQADRQACLAAVQKYRPDIQLCADQYQNQADKEADYDNTHGAHSYLKAYGWSGTCSSPYTPQCVGQCECPNWGSETWQDCIDAYYKEGPGGGHYDIMMNQGAKCVACGYGGGTMTNNFCNGESLPSIEGAVVV